MTKKSLKMFPSVSIPPNTTQTGTSSTSSELSWTVKFSSCRSVVSRTSQLPFSLVSDTVSEKKSTETRLGLSLDVEGEAPLLAAGRRGDTLARPLLEVAPLRRGEGVLQSWNKHIDYIQSRFNELQWLRV